MTQRRYRTLNLPQLDRAAFETERRRLIDGPRPDEAVLGDRPNDVFFVCKGDAAQVLERAKQAMLCVNEQALGEAWPSLERWPDLLPPWFVAACVSEQEWAEIDAVTPPRYQLPVEQWTAAEIAEKWTLGAWTFWMDPRERGWLWWDGEARDENLILMHIDCTRKVECQVPDELLWLFGAAGAVDYSEAEHRADRILANATDYDRKSRAWRHQSSGLVDMSRNALLVERERLEHGLKEGEDCIGMESHEFRILGTGRAEQILQRATVIMEIVNRYGLEEAWPSDSEWPALLPDWFVSACLGDDESSASETDRPDRSENASVRTTSELLSEKWALPAWTYWMDPEEREWLWMNAEVEDDDTVKVVIDRLGDPPPGPPPGFLWLFSACGASDYEEVCHAVDDSFSRERMYALEGASVGPRGLNEGWVCSTEEFEWLFHDAVLCHSSPQEIPTLHARVTRQLKRYLNNIDRIEYAESGGVSPNLVLEKYPFDEWRALLPEFERVVATLRAAPEPGDPYHFSSEEKRHKFAWRVELLCARIRKWLAHLDPSSSIAETVHILRGPVYSRWGEIVRIAELADGSNAVQTYISGSGWKDGGADEADLSHTERTDKAKLLRQGYTKRHIYEIFAPVPIY